MMPAARALANAEIALLSVLIMSAWAIATVRFAAASVSGIAMLTEYTWCSVGT